MVKDHSDSKIGNPLQQLHGLHFQLAAWDLLYAPFHRQITYHSCGALAGMRNSSMARTKNSLMGPT